jgi:hypothetical protein
VRQYPDIWSTPYGKSPLTFFVGQAEAQLVGGNFVFDGAPLPFIVRNPLISQSVYWFMDFDFSVDCAEADFTASISRVPLLSVYQSSNPTQPIFRQPFPTPVYFRNKWILQGIRSLTTPNELLFSLDGIVSQTPSLLGKSTLRATVQFTAFEITDPDYIARLMNGLDVEPPRPPKGPMTPTGAPGEDLALVSALNPGIQMEGGLRLPAA